jgi:GT2 family glycosyltransferase
MPFLHIIVLGYGRFQQNTQPCLESMLPIPQEIEATIFDNGSADDSPSQQSLFIKQNHQIHSILNQDNLGFAGGMNAAVNQLPSPCEWLLLVGNDTVFHPQALQRLLRALKETPKDIGIVGPLTNSAGTSQGLMSLGNSISEIFKNWDQLPDHEEPIFSPLYRTDFFCVAIRKSLWDTLGGLDISYGRGYYEDFDFCMRAKAIGFKCMMLENALVYHQGSASFKNDPTQSLLIRKNKALFVSKFPNTQLRHRRQDHLKSLEHYLTQKHCTKERVFLLAIAELRIQSIELDMPKSYFKKWLWQTRIKKLAKLVRL